MEFNRTITGSCVACRVAGSATFNIQAKLEGAVRELIFVENDGFSSEPMQPKGRCGIVIRNRYTSRKKARVIERLREVDGIVA